MLTSGPDAADAVPNPQSYRGSWLNSGNLKIKKQIKNENNDETLNTEIPVGNSNRGSREICEGIITITIHEIHI